MEDNETDKTEQPTPFKLDRSRKKGVVARGADLGLMAASAASLGYFWIGGQNMANAFANAARDALRDGPALAEGHYALIAVLTRICGMAVPPLLFFMAVVFASVLLVEIVQTGGTFSADPLRPDFSRLNPANGFKRVFSLRALIETGKNVLKIVVYTTIAFLVISAALRVRVGAISDARSLIAELRGNALRLLGAFVLAAMGFAVLDQLISRNSFLKRMRMSRRELRREAREREGEPRLKQKRKQLHRQLAMTSQSLRNLRKADVLVTNPAHLALALQYDAKTMIAPSIVSIGTNHVAQRFKRIAFLYGIPIVENRTLAQALYRKGALNGAIPSECYQPVADIYNALRTR